MFSVWCVKYDVADLDMFKVAVMQTAELSSKIVQSYKFSHNLVIRAMF